MHLNINKLFLIKTVLHSELKISTELSKRSTVISTQKID